MDLNQAPDRRHGNRPLQVQILRKTSRVGWVVQIRTPKIWVSSPYLLAYRCHQDTHHAAGSNPQKDASSGLDRRDHDIKDEG